VDRIRKWYSLYNWWWKQFKWINSTKTTFCYDERKMAFSKQ